MPDESGDSQMRKEQVGSYAARWLKDSRDDVPQTDRPPRPNSVVQAIMTNGNSTNEQAGHERQRAAGQDSSESER